ncbi:uncharacterized protein LOC108211409 [Daucus carota subsp. sativus]|uniref:uncharacterized protein LOC108211409 n=1 Tax=Daucus carota subsp. sativus TaxID=79200 RepID=UPI0007EF9E04|nr:PREDICTED: uncharacterized protein LOC108211409 [Daucus carota subsp. sativus]
MRLQHCSALHYINAIKGDSVSKVLNVNSRRKPALVFKSLEEIYEDKHPRHLNEPSEAESQNGCENGEVKDITKNLCLPKAERITMERDQVSTDFECSDYEEMASESDDLSFGEMTLKELRKTCKLKKRKMSDSVCSSPEFQEDGDDCDLMIPLSSWNTTLSKIAKSTKKHARRSASAILAHDCTYPQQSSNANFVPMTIKIEASTFCLSELQALNFAAETTDGPSSSGEQVSVYDMDSSQILQTSDTILENKETISLAGQQETCVNISGFLENKETISSAGQCEARVNTFSLSQPEVDYMPLSFIPPPSEKTVGSGTQESCRHPASRASELHKESDILQSPSSQSFLLTDKNINDKSLVIHKTKDEVSEMPLDNGISSTNFVNGSELCVFEDDARNRLDMLSAPQSCLNMPEILWNESEYRDSNVATSDGLCLIKSGRGITLSIFDDVNETNLPHHLPNVSPRSPFSYYISPWNFYPCSASDSDLVAEEIYSRTIENDWSLTTYNSNTSGYCVEPNIYPTDLEDAAFANEKQLLLPINTDAEISLSGCDDNELSSPETCNQGDIVLWQPPERFPSTKKVISPTFQEKVCLTTNYRELTDDIGDHKCKGKRFVGNQTEDNALSEVSDTTGVESCAKGELTEQRILRKAILSPKKILKKSKHNKKGSLPEKCSPIGRLVGSQPTRLLPGMYKGRSSIEACHERAISFSQRQMQDIESVAAKLMTELKSMKDMVEEKLLYEAYRSTSMKNDADEVKSAIKSATKVEETTKKWLSMMARDCNRFCKIMSQPQKSTLDASAAKETMMHREKKKISFADEAGGVLCHVKYFEYGENNTNLAS